MKSVGIIGGSGYTGGELIRLVIHHPALKLDFVYSTTRAGKAVTSAHPDLLGSLNLNFTDTVNPEIDLLYLCLGHGNSRAFLENYSFSEKTIIIDLGNDFRLNDDREFGGKQFVYGLPELQREEIEKATAIANPGCFATAIQLALLPLAKNNLIKDAVHINATTGSTGAGVGLSATSHFSWRNNNLSWYKPFTHQHLGEIHQSLQQLKAPSKLFFMPQRGDFTRGIFATAYTQFEGSLEEAKALYQKYYASHPFTQISDEEVSLKSVVNTNFCFLHLHKYENTLLITSVIDNLVKGASGQAIQNTNILMGWEENLGIQLKASIF
jgi:N-acetyl-gamma-glutamyl-phosphate reductase